jgi:hypothetical protein
MLNSKFQLLFRSASRFDKFADPSAPPADLFNIWRDDYMLSPQASAAEAADRAKNSFFDGILPPFSNVGNTERDLGKCIRGLGWSTFALELVPVDLIICDKNRYRPDSPPSW